MDETKLALAADLWHAVAQYEMARIHYRARRPKESLHSLLCSGAQGYPPALFRLHFVYFCGGDDDRGAQRNFHLAYLLCKEAAMRGHEDAEFTQRVFGASGAFSANKIALQPAVTNAVALAKRGNRFAQQYIDATLRCSPSMLRKDSDATEEDLEFLEKTIGYSRDEEAYD